MTEPSTKIHRALGKFLQWAVWRGSIRIAKLALALGAKPHGIDDLYPPLHVVAAFKSIGLANLLLESGEEVNTQNRMKETPLHKAAGSGRLDMAWFLVTHGADPTIKDSDRCTPITCAEQNDNLLVAQYLKDCAKPAHAEEWNQQLHWYRMRLPRDCGKQPRSWWADCANKWLLWAASRNRSIVVRLALYLGADVNAYDNSGRTALHRAAYIYHEVTALLLAKGANPNAVDNYGNAPIHRAVCWDKVEQLELLVTHGANINFRDSYGLSPRKLANIEGNKEVAKYLASLGGKALGSSAVFDSATQQKAKDTDTVNAPIRSSGDRAQTHTSFSWSKGGNDLSDKEIAKLASSLDADRIMRALVSSSETASIRLSIALTLNDNFSACEGLLLHSRSVTSETYDLASRLTDNEPSGQFVCNKCGATYNLGATCLRQRFEKGEICAHPREGEFGYNGVKLASDGLRELEGAA